MRTLALALVLVSATAWAEPAPTAPPAPNSSVVLRQPQMFRGVRVRGGGELFTTRADGSVAYRDHRVTDLSVDTVPTVTRAALAQLVGPTQSVALVILPWRSGGVLAWEARVARDAYIGPERVLVDAHTGAVLARMPLARDAHGNVYAKHPAAGAPIAVELPALAGDGLHLTGARAFVSSLVWDEGGASRSVQLALADEAGDFLYEPDASSLVDPFAEVTAYWHVSRASAFFEDQFGVVPVAPAVVVVNYREAADQPYENAFAYRDPDSGRYYITAGQADGLDMAYDGMTLVHEFGHPVFDALNEVSENNTYPIASDERGFNPAPNALNEGASDYWAASVFDDPNVLSQFDEEVSARNVDNALRCPNDVWGEAHLDAPLVSGTFWKVREVLGAARADAIVFDVLGRLSDSPTFDEMAQHILDAVDLAVTSDDITTTERATIAAMLAERGLIGCGREIELSDDVSFTAHMPGAETAAALVGTDADLCDTLRVVGVQIPLAFAYRTHAPDVAVDRIEALEVDIDFVRADAKPVGEIDLQYQLLVRKDTLVTFEVVSIPFGGQEFQLPIRPDQYDVARDEQPTHVRLTKDDLELAPGATYYLNILALNCPLTTHTVTTRWIVTPEPEPEGVEPGPEPEPEAAPDSSPDADGSEPAVKAEGGGCAGGESPGSWAMLALALVALIRARRRSRA